MSKTKRVLILTSSGGGGLLQTATAKEQEIRELDSKAEVIQIDILQHWLGKIFGTFCSEFWNRPQRTGHVWILKLIANVLHPFFDFAFWPIIFVGALRTFFKVNADRILDTQPMCTSAILCALRIFNKKKNKNLYLEKILVDLPTPKATHYFRSIKKLSAVSRNAIRLVTIQPLLAEGETAQQFWQKHCRLSEDLIQYEEPFVRSAFRKFRGKARSKQTISLKVRYKSAAELKLMERIYGRGAIEAELGDKEIWFKVKPSDRLITILLGSQPAGKATLNYAKRFLELAKRQPNQRTHLFLFRDEHKGRHSLLHQMAEWIEKTEPYPAHFSIIPFGFQSDDVIAPLFHRSDLTCTRSGGQTAMELLSVSTGEMWIHSETKGEEGLTDEQLLKGIPGWEAASAVYLQKLRGAKIVTPDSFISVGKKFFRINKE